MESRGGITPTAQNPDPHNLAGGTHPLGQLLTCDICSKTAFDSYEALCAHVDRTHGDMFPDREDLSLMIEKIRPLMSSVLHPDNGDQWIKWGEKTLAVAKQRDAGPGKLAEACGARAQLDEIARQWHPTATVFVFGSSVAMGLWDGLSDVDFIVVDVKAADVGEWPPQERTGVRSLGTLLRRAGFAMQNLEVVDGARVPIIKHHAPTSLARLPDKETSDLIARSVRFIFNEPLVPAERILFEGGVRDAIGGVAPQHLWWNPRGDVAGITLQSKLDAVKVLVHQPVLSTTHVVHRAPLHDDIRPDIFGVDFDLGFRVFGIRNSELLRRCLSGHRCARPGALVLKEWSKSSGVNNSPGGYLTSYAINILWIYYLIQKGHVDFVDPLSIPVSLVGGKIDKDPKYVPLIPTDVHSSPEALSKFYQEMGALLIGFYAFYCFEFDWKNTVVSLNKAEVTTKADLGWTVDSVLGGKGKNVRYQLCIEDPYEENLNLGRHIGECRWRKVQSEFHRALVSLIKDPVDQSSVFGWVAETSTTAAAAAATDGKDGANLVAGGAGGSGATTSTPKPPGVEAMGTLMAITVETVEASSDLSVMSAVLEEKFKEIAPEEYQEAISFYSWKQLIQELGYQVLGKKVRARRNLGSRTPKRLTSFKLTGGLTEAQKIAQIERQATASASGENKDGEEGERSKGDSEGSSISRSSLIPDGASSYRAPATVYQETIPVNPLDTMTDEIIAEYLLDHGRRPTGNSARDAMAGLPKQSSPLSDIKPEWLVYNGPPSSAGRSQTTIHVPGHRTNTKIPSTTTKTSSSSSTFWSSSVPPPYGSPSSAVSANSSGFYPVADPLVLSRMTSPLFVGGGGSGATPQQRLLNTISTEAMVQRGSNTILKRLIRRF